MGDVSGAAALEERTGLAEQPCSEQLGRAKTVILREHSINLGGHDEIAFGEAVDLVRPDRDFGLAPR